MNNTVPNVEYIHIYVTKNLDGIDDFIMQIEDEIENFDCEIIDDGVCRIGIKFCDGVLISDLLSFLIN